MSENHKGIAPLVAMGLMIGNGVFTGVLSGGKWWAYMLGSVVAFAAVIAGAIVGTGKERQDEH